MKFSKVRQSGDSFASFTGVELVNLRIVRPGFGIPTVRLMAVHLRCLGVTKRLDGRIVVRPPKILSRDGSADYGAAYALQSGVREAIEAAIAGLWDQAEAESGK